MKYILDTNIILLYLRNKETKKYIENKYQLFKLPNIPIISIVAVGEIKSLAIRNKWGIKRIQALIYFLNELVVTDINSEDVVNRYAEIDAYSQGKLTGKPLNKSSRNMGKNDLWIAATASVSKSILMTTDSDFDHLHNVYIELSKIKV